MLRHRIAIEATQAQRQKTGSGNYVRNLLRGMPPLAIRFRLNRVLRQTGAFVFPSFL